MDIYIVILLEEEVYLIMTSNILKPGRCIFVRKKDRPLKELEMFIEQMKVSRTNQIKDKILLLLRRLRQRKWHTREKQNQ